MVRWSGSILYVAGIQVVRVYTAMRSWWSGLVWSGSILSNEQPGLVLDLGLNFFLELSPRFVSNSYSCSKNSVEPVWKLERTEKCIVK